MRLIATLLMLSFTSAAFAQAPAATHFEGEAKAEADANVAHLLKYYEHGKRREFDAQVEFWSRNAMNNGERARPESLRAALEDIRRTFPDYASTVLEMRAVGDTVVALSRISGTHQGTAQTRFFGGMLQGVKPTGKKFEVLVTHWWRWQDGKIVWHQATRDELGMLRQLGLIASPTAQ